MTDVQHQQFRVSSGGFFQRIAGMIDDWRNGRILDPAFQRWATAFWITRPMVRRRQKELFDLTAGFVYSQVLSACVSLRVFENLKTGPLRCDDLALRIGLEPLAAERLVAAAAAIKLLKVKGDTVRLADLGAAMLANPGVAAMIEHHAMFYRDLSDPVALLRGDVGQTELSQFWGYATASAPDALGRERVDDYSHLMAVSQAMISAEIIAAYPFKRHRCLLDVGGGQGAFVGAVGEAYPDLALSTFDLPAVSARAREKLDDKGFGHRFTAYGGSFFDDPLPKGADIISLVRVLYDHSDEKVLKILRAVREALPKDGVLLVAEPMANTPGAEAMGSAYFGFYLMAMRSGRSRSQNEITALLNTAGFNSVKCLKTRSPVLTSVLTARV